MQPEAPLSPLGLQTLQAAEQLRQKREAERANLTKSQLTKTRRKLSKLYNKAQEQVQASGSVSGISFSEAGQPADDWAAHASESICAQPTEDDTLEHSCQAVPGSAGDAATAEAGPVLASADVTSPTASGNAVEPQPDQGDATTREHHHPQPLWPPGSSRQQPGLMPQLPPHTAPIRPLPPAGRGRHMDMSRLMHVLHGQLKSRDTPQAPGAHVQVHSSTTHHVTHVVTSEPAQDGALSHEQPGWASAAARAQSQEAAAQPAANRSAPGGNQQQQQQRKAKQKQFIYGNYHGYYGYRYANMDAFRDDPRLGLLQADWFAGRHMLDVGCNEGLVTLAVAARFGCASATGVDIDKALITKATKNLRTFRTSVNEQLRAGPARQHPHQGQGQSRVKLESVTSLAEGCDLEDGASHASHGSFDMPAGGAELAGAGAAQVVTHEVQVVQSAAAVRVVEVEQQQGEQQQGEQQGEQQNQEISVQVGEQQQQQVVVMVHEEVQVQGAAVATSTALVASERQMSVSNGDQEGPVMAAQSSDGGAGRGGHEAGHLQEGQQGEGARGVRQGSAGPPPPGFTSWASLRTAAKALSNVQFIHQDWANDDEVDRPGGQQAQGGGNRPGGQQPGVPRVRTRFGVIMCLSVTKWVHINWGDEGLLRLFKRFQTALEKGGYLVLEPQPWRSYQAAGRKHSSGIKGSKELSERLNIRPEGFVQLLTQEYGFELLADLNQSSSAVGFDRPMYVFRKTGGRRHGVGSASSSLMSGLAAGAGAGGSLTCGGSGKAGTGAGQPGSHTHHPARPQLSAQGRGQSGSVALSGPGSGVVGGGGGSSASQGLSQGSVGSSRKRRRGPGPHISRRHQRQSRAEDLLVIEDDEDEVAGGDGGGQDS